MAYRSLSASPPPYTCAEEGSKDAPKADGLTQRVRRFLTFNLAVDYRCQSHLREQDKLQSDDFRHFVRMAALLAEVNHDWFTIKEAYKRDEAIVEYLDYHLARPAAALNVPLPAVAMMIKFYPKYMDCVGKYTSWFYYFNLAKIGLFAPKLLLDELVLLPAVVRDPVL